MGNITLSEKHYAHTLLEMLTFAHLDTSDMQVSLGSPLGRGHADIQTLNMQVLVDNLPGHGHTDMHWIYRCQWTAPLDADIRTLDMQVSVDSLPGRGHLDIGHAGVSGQPPWMRTFGHWTCRCLRQRVSSACGIQTGPFAAH